MTLACLALAAPAATAAPAGSTRLQGGKVAGGTWELAAKRTRSAGMRGVCLELAVTFADGSSPGSGGGCAVGSLPAGKNIFPLSTSSRSGAEVTTSVVGGLVTSRARTVRVRFADGTRMTLRTKRPPAGWRRVLGMTVRSYGADALPRTTARVRHVRGYDRHGHRVAG